jgi:hypothetical protein
LYRHSINVGHQCTYPDTMLHVHRRGKLERVQGSQTLGRLDHGLNLFDGRSPDTRAPGDFVAGMPLSFRHCGGMTEGRLSEYASKMRPTHGPRSRPGNFSTRTLSSTGYAMPLSWGQ